MFVKSVLPLLHTKFTPSTSSCSPKVSDVNKDWTCKDKDKDKDQAYKDQDKDKDQAYKDQDKD